MGVDQAPAQPKPNEPVIIVSYVREHVPQTGGCDKSADQATDPFESPIEDILREASITIGAELDGPPTDPQQGDRAGVANPQIAIFDTAIQNLTDLDNFQKQIWANSTLWNNINNADSFSAHISAQIELIVNGLKQGPEATNAWLAEIANQLEQTALYIEKRLIMAGVSEGEAGRCKDIFLTQDPLREFGRPFFGRPIEEALQAIATLSPDQRRLAVQALINFHIAKAVVGVVGSEVAGNLHGKLDQNAYEANFALATTLANLNVRGQLPPFAPIFITQEARAQLSHSRAAGR